MANFIRSITVLLIVLSCTNLYAQTEKTGPMINGRFWQALNLEAKAPYVIGLHEGLEWFSIMSQQMSSDEKINERINNYFVQNYTCNLTFREKIEQLDRFYSDSANIIIPVLWAYGYITMKSKGANPQFLEEELSRLRKNSHLMLRNFKN